MFVLVVSGANSQTNWPGRVARIGHGLTPLKHVDVARLNQLSGCATHSGHGFTPVGRLFGASDLGRTYRLVRATVGGLFQYSAVPVIRSVQVHGFERANGRWGSLARSPLGHFIWLDLSGLIWMVRADDRRPAAPERAAGFSLCL